MTHAQWEMPKLDCRQYLGNAWNIDIRNIVESNELSIPSSALLIVSLAFLTFGFGMSKKTRFHSRYIHLNTIYKVHSDFIHPACPEAESRVHHMQIRRPSKSASFMIARSCSLRLPRHNVLELSTIHSVNATSLGRTTVFEPSRWSIRL